MPSPLTDIEHTTARKVAEAVSLVRFRGVSPERAAEIVCLDIESVVEQIAKGDTCRVKLDPDIPTPEEIAAACLRFREICPRRPVGLDPSRRVEITEYEFNAQRAEFSTLSPDSP